MGYRSEVRIYLEENDKFNLDNVVSDVKSIEDIADYMKISTNTDKKRVLCVSYSDVKWYQGYDLVDYWDNIFKVLNDSDKDNCYKFARIGEEDDDFEVHGNYGEIYLVRDFDLDNIDFDEDNCINIK